MPCYACFVYSGRVDIILMVSKSDEELLFRYEETGAKVYVYRFPNVFGNGAGPTTTAVIIFAIILPETGRFK